MSQLNIKYTGPLNKFIGLTFDYDLSKKFATVGQIFYISAMLKKIEKTHNRLQFHSYARRLFQQALLPQNIRTH